MDPLTIAAGIGAISNLAGGFISSAGAANQNAMSWQQAQQQMQFSAAQAQKQMDFQERMSNTQYQRGMADMRAAGLNPILAYQQGGASAPTGAAGQSAGAKFENAMEGIGHGASSAGQAMRNYLDMANVKATTDNTVTQSRLNDANTQLSNVNAATSAANARKADAETANIIASADNPAAIRALMAAQSSSAYAAAGLSAEQTKQLQQYGPHWTGQVTGSVGRVWDRLKGAYSTGAISSPTDPRAWGLKGRPGEGPGLVIDIKK